MISKAEPFLALSTNIPLNDHITEGAYAGIIDK
jgi:hypothetical protein